MKGSLLALIVCFSITAHAQNDSMKSKEPDWYGEGNNTFVPTIKVLQSYFTKRYTVKQFEKTLGNFERCWYKSDTTRYNTDINKKDSAGQYIYDSVKIVMPYFNKRGNTTDELYVSYDAKQKITSIRFILEEDQVRVDKLGIFVKQLKSAGYKQDIAYTRINRSMGSYRSLFLENHASKTSVRVTFIDEYRYSITISK